MRTEKSSADIGKLRSRWRSEEV